MKIYIEGQEWYPVYTIVGDYGAEAEVSQDFIDVYNRFLKDYEIIQNILRDLYDKYYKRKK